MDDTTITDKPTPKDYVEMIVVLVIIGGVIVKVLF